MSNVKWIKLSTNMFDDEKIRLIEQMPDADTILIIWVKLLAQAGKTNASGYIFLSENIPYTDEMLAAIFNRPLNTVRLALQTFKEFGMIDIDEKSLILISNWEKHQNVAGMDRMREQTRKRVQKHRENKRIEAQEDNDKKPVTLHVTPSNATEEELEEELDIDKDIKNKCIRDLFDHYLSKNIIRHQKLTDSMKRTIGARLRDFTAEELKQAINNYATVYLNDDYWFSYKYSITDLMREKDILKFIDDAEPLKNFAKKQREDDPNGQGVSQHRRSYGGPPDKGKSYAEAMQQLEAANKAFRRV